MSFFIDPTEDEHSTNVVLYTTLFFRDPRSLLSLPGSLFAPPLSSFPILLHTRSSSQKKKFSNLWQAKAGGGRGRGEKSREGGIPLWDAYFLSPLRDRGGISGGGLLTNRI